MKFRPGLIFFTVLFLFSCNQNKPADKIVVVGEDVDSVAIAGDTAMQMAIDNSYEYSKALPVTEKLVFDVIAYGGPPSHGDYAILRRGSNNKADTVAHGERRGIIFNAFTADLNENKKPEVYLVLRTADRHLSQTLIAWEFDANGNSKAIELPAELTGNGNSEDRIYLLNKHIALKTKLKTDYFELKNTKLVLAKSVRSRN